MAKMQNKFYTLSIQLIIVLMLFFPLLVYAGDEGFGADSSALSVRNIDQDTPPASNAAAIPKRAAFVAKPPAKGLSPAEGRFVIKSDRKAPPQISPRGELEVKIDDHHSSSGKIVADVVDLDQNSRTSSGRILESIDPNSAYESVTPASPPPPSASSPKKKKKSQVKLSAVPNVDMGSGAASASLNKKFTPRVQPRTLAKAQGKIEIGRSTTSVGVGNDQTAVTKESPAFAKSIVDQDDVKATVVVTLPSPSLPPSSQMSDVGATGKAAAVKRQFVKKTVGGRLAKPVHVDSLPIPAAKASVVQRVINDGAQINLNAPRVMSQNKVLAIETRVMGALITDGLESDIIMPGLAIFNKDTTHNVQIVWPQITQSLEVDTSTTATDMEEKIMDINDENITPSISDGRVLARDIPQVLMQSKEIVSIANVAIPQIQNGVRFEFDLAESILQPKDLVLNATIVELQRISGGTVADQELPHLQMMQKAVLVANTQVIRPFVFGGRSIAALPGILMQPKVIEPSMGIIDGSSVSAGNQIVSDLPPIGMNQQDFVASEDIILPVVVQGEEASTSMSIAMIPKQMQMTTNVLTQVLPQGREAVIDLLVPQMRVKELAPMSEMRTSLIKQGQAFDFEIPQVLIQEKAIIPVDNLSQSKIRQGSLAIMDLPGLRMQGKEVPSRETQVVVSNIKVGNKIEMEVQLPGAQMRPKGREAVMDIAASLISQGKGLTGETAPVIGLSKKVDVIAEVNIPIIERGIEVDNTGPDLVVVRKVIVHSENIALSRIVRGGEVLTSSPPIPMVLKNPMSFPETSLAPISGSKEIDINIHDPLMMRKEVIANTITITPKVEQSGKVDIDIPDIPILPKVIIPDLGHELPQISLGRELDNALPQVPMLSKRREAVIGIVMPLIEEGNEFVDDLPLIGMKQKDVIASNSIILPIIALGLEVDESQPVAHVNDKHIASEVIVISPAISLGNKLDTNIDSIPAKLHVTEGDTTILMPIDSPVNYSTSQTNSQEEYTTEEQGYNSMNDQLSLGSDEVALGSVGDEFISTMPVSEITKTVADYVKHGMHYAISSFETINAIISARLDIFKSELTVGVAAGDENNVVEKGVWSKIFTSKTTQDNSVGKAEFNNNQNGFIIGFDSELRDENVFGIAVTKSDSKTDFFSSVDNSQKSDLYSVILYNEMSLTDKLYLNTNLKYGKAYVKHKIHTVIPLSGKTTADIFSASIDSVYKHKSLNGTLISPILRFTFSNFFIDDFSEINDEIKVYIPQKRARVLIAQSGMGFKRAIAVGKSRLEIEFHGGIERMLALRQSNDMITIVSDVSEHIQGKFVHPTKTRYNFGANLAIVTGIGLRAGLAADHIFANRYKSSGAFLFLVYHF